LLLKVIYLLKKKKKNNVFYFFVEKVHEKEGQQASNDPLHGNVNYGLEAESDEFDDEQTLSTLFDTDG